MVYGADEYSLTDSQQDFDLNLTRSFLVWKYSLKKMLQQGYGRIVMVGWQSAIAPIAKLAAYCASKAVW
jgi:short-subunit dehydrogenase